MRSTYSGRVSLVVGDTEFPATASLDKRVVHNIPEWDGTVEVDDDHLHAFEALTWDLDDYLRVRLPEGGEGNAFISRMAAGTGHAMLKGSGPAPW